ncbi:serine/threonine-protein kinase LMTK2 isoform X1 [Pleuronectes platessa]|uniref:serine/threonine-protein kinase LMTK2 isoform X1 n=1 Tax=Pleuronectes platessa TaxID=8262 RepID=UPI00232A3220|nr:serine/threonine-protein kinase LMTK2 isoform X1 [Pleuronectes platessa]XP_053298889.1 serine/threonine-protein kinase LMTK2 isoform X1 [Pleuronectes platessa]
MGSRHGYVLLLASGILLSAVWLSEGAPLRHHHKSAVSTGDTASTSLYLALVVSLTALLVLVVLLVNCVTCCKEREINFKEFEDHFEDEIDFTPPAEDTPSMQSPAEVYTLAVSPVALPGPPHLQPPARLTEGSTSFQVARHNLSYIQEIGNGWFGQVLLSEIYTDPGGTRVVVKELKANANAKEQNDFLQQGDPYRVLQHPNILQCLGQCVEAIPFLLVFEYCEMGDLRGYLSQQDWMFRNAELLQLQRMACEIAAGVTHLHKHNFLHSDLALRNCYLTADLTVRVGDYGIGPYRYKEDYIITEDDVFAPLRWLAPELVGERHGGVITIEQTKPSNVWALGVTLWELFESATQPYPHLSDREVLNHVIKEQQVKLFKPQLELPYSDRWFEVLQFCWLSPDKRATAEEVHRLLIYLRMQGQKDIEEDFDQRWDALKPNPSTRQTTVSHSSYPILEQFADDALRQEIDEVLTVTETSKGLSFEYVWEAAKHDHYEGSHGRSGMDTTLNYHSMFFPASSEDIQAHFPEQEGRAVGTESGNTPSGIPGIVPVFDAQKPCNGNEYYIQLEEQGESNVGVDGNRGQHMDYSSGRQDFVVLQDVRLDESSTDADFFHQSIDSKDSYLPDSHIWSSLENDSPYHTNIFTEGGSKQEDSPSWTQTFMELPERNGNPFHTGLPLDIQDADEDNSYGSSFLEDRSEATQRVDPLKGDQETTDMMVLLNTDKLSDNFMFLTEQNLMKDGSSFLSPQQNFLSPGMAHQPEDTFKMRSWDNLDTLGSLDTVDTYSKPAASSTSSRQKLVDSPHTSVGEFSQSLVDNKTLVPSITVVTDDNTSNQLPVRDSSSAEDLGLLQASDRGVDSGFDSTSERFEVVISQSDAHTPAFSESATIDSWCTDAKIPSLEVDLGTSKDSAPLGGSEMPENFDVQVLSSDIGHSEDLTSNDLLSELLEDADIELETTLSDHEESFVDTNGEPLVRSSLLVSGPSLDQISQDSLLDDSMSATLPTIDNSAETPDSLDSLDIHRLGEQGEELNGQIAQNKLQPPHKISDSGYETENLESPEWNFQANATAESPVKNGTNVAKEEEETEECTAAANLVPPEIIISEVEVVPDTQSEDAAEAQQPDQVPPAQEAPMGSNYRDSAYFSDNDSEPEKRAEESGVSAEVPWLRNSIDEGSKPSAGPAPEPNADSDIVSLVTQQKSSGTAETQAEAEEKPTIHVWGLFSRIDSDITEEQEGEAAINLNEDENKSDFIKDATTTPDQPDQSEDPETSIPLPSATPSKQENAVHAKLTRTYASDGHKIRESDVEGRYLGRRDGSGSEVEEEDVDADEEDENSDDSDDDVRAYRLHSSSSESEDDTVHPVPLIVSDDSRAKNLKSLLKPSALNAESLSPFSSRSSADNSRRAVSFFDDVTVYLFDQETPTKELADHSSGLNSQVPEFSSPGNTASYLNRFTNSESSTDEEGGGFEWDDDFSSAGPAFLPQTDKDPVSKAMSSSATSRFSSPPLAAGRTLEPSWSGSSNYSRFSISPASIASFSLTHLTDSDIEQGGSSEDGEKDECDK